MDSNRINELLKKYWSCETSLEEEAELREIFKAGNVPDELKETAPLFQYFEENKKKIAQRHLLRGTCDGKNPFSRKTRPHL